MSTQGYFVAYALTFGPLLFMLVGRILSGSDVEDKPAPVRLSTRKRRKAYRYRGSL